MRLPLTVGHRHASSFGWTAFLLLPLMANSGQVAAKACKDLTYEERNEWTTCNFPLLMLESNGTEYPEFDISHFSQDDMTKFQVVRDDLGNPDPSQTRSFAGNLICHDSSLQSITLGFLIPNSSISQSIRLENNLQLTKVHFPQSISSIKFNETIKFIVSGNKLLDEESITKLNAIAYKSEDSYIQGYGECVIDRGQQKSFEELDKCRYLKGDLIINDRTDTTSKFPGTLKDIQGCIYVKRSKLIDLEFLNTVEKSNCSGTHEITNNPELCLFPEKLENIKTKFKNMNTSIKIEKNNGCKGECTWKYLNEQRDERCLIVTETVTLSGTKNSENLKHLSQIEEIRGRLIIRNTEFSTIDMFPNLHTISYTVQKDSAIFIYDNMNLTNFDFPSLKNITVIDKSVIAFVLQDNNPNFAVADEQYERFSNLTGGRLILQRQSSVGIQRVENSTEAVEKETVEEEKSYTGLIIGLTIGGVVLVVIIVTAVGVYICLKRAKRVRETEKMKQEEERENELTRRAAVADWTTVSFSVEKVVQMREGLGSKSDSARSIGSDLSLKSGGSISNLRAQKIYSEAKEYQDVSGAYLATAGKFYNLECTRTTDQNIIKIKRDKLGLMDIEEIADGTCESMTSTARVYTHNMKYSLYTIRPRQEDTDEYKYDTDNVNIVEGEQVLRRNKREMNANKQFDPREFIAACMKSSNVYPSGRVMIAALDYALKKGNYKGNVADQVLFIDGPVHMVGDTHGSLIDLQTVLSLDPKNVYSMNGIHPLCKYKYLFTGDYLDRGTFDTVCFAFLCVLSTYFKNRYYLLRGNHEWMINTSDWNKRVRDLWPEKEADQIYEKIRQLSDRLPLVAIVNKRIFAVHGGISPKLVEISKKEKKGLIEILREVPYPLRISDEIEKDIGKCYETLEQCHKDRKDLDGGKLKGVDNEQKRKKIGDLERSTRDELAKFDKYNELVRSLLWADPSPMSNANNLPRCCGNLYNEKEVNDFLSHFKLDLIVRGHQMVGFSNLFAGKLITLFASFDHHGSGCGVPYFFSDKSFPEHIEELPTLPSLGVLRLEPNGTLHTMLFRHAYMTESETKQLSGLNSRPLPFKPKKVQKSEHKAVKNDSNKENDKAQQPKGSEVPNSNISRNSKIGGNSKSNQATPSHPHSKAKSEGSPTPSNLSQPSSVNDPKSKPSDVAPAKGAQKK